MTQGIKTEVLGFDEWFKENYPNQWAFKDSTLTCKSFYDGMKIGSASRQAEIDEQFVANCKQTDHIHKLQREHDELQKRIDDLKNINESLVDYKNQLLDELKGENNE